jgi:two-component system, chemotaxis family, chemotaxis protein CheY
MKVLVVDDSGIMRKVIIRELVSMNISQNDISEVDDGEKAVQAAMSTPFSLILMDWNMPNMLGIDAVKAIRAGGVNTPILMVTTESERSNVVKAIQAGANNYLVKPFTGEALKEKIVSLLPELSL